MNVDVKEYADRLDGCEYGSEGSKELFEEMRDRGLVAVFGYSDDCVEFRGAFHDEFSAPGEVHLNRVGILVNECEEEDCPYYRRLVKLASVIESLWGEEPGVSWTYGTTIPHETFSVMEDGETYCRGIVFSLSDVPLVPENGDS